ncbi:MAG: SpoIID/LytB domain-containing protein [Tissierellales bacterium]
MKKSILSIILALFLSFALSNQAAAYENVFLEVALKSALDPASRFTVNLTSDGFQLGTWGKEFYHLFDLSNSNLVVLIDGYYMNTYNNYQKANDAYLATYGPFHIMTNRIFHSYEDALYEVENLRKLSIDAFVYFHQDSFEIWIGHYTDEAIAKEEAMKYLDYSDNQFDISKDNKNRIMLLDDNNNIMLMFDINHKIYLSSLSTKNGGLVTIGSNSYRDYITFSRVEDELLAINNLEMQNYLYGVLPREAYSSWPIEALKAQAVASKNFALVNMNKHINEGYNLCDTTHCQAYGGYNLETIKTNTAVDETSGRVLMYSDTIVNAYYHSSSGGHTEDSENVWSEAIPYLRGVDDDFSFGSPYDSWQFEISPDELETKLLEIDLDLGYIEDISIVSRFNSGRVKELLISGNMGKQVFEKEKIRQVLGTSNIKSNLYDVYINDGTKETNLSQNIYVYNLRTGDIEKKPIDNAIVLSSEGLSELDSVLLSKGFTITDGINNRELTNRVENNIVNSEGKYVFSGKGWGHGVGMSQWGAKKMAELGYEYDEILEYYYEGAKVK